MEFQSTNTAPLTKSNIIEAANTLDVEPAAVQAVTIVEDGGRSGFLPAPDNRPVILFESHAFHTNTRGIYDSSYPDISTSSWIKNYGASGSHQWDRLNKAISLNRPAALMSASWGKFQIMGSNWKLAGCTDIEAFVAAMCWSEEYQLAAFIAFIQETNLVTALQDLDWNTFAKHYNGPGNVSDYSYKMVQAYAKAVAEGYNS